jgi:CubicO group peptidase (beta-lactamase class C family)
MERVMIHGFCEPRFAAVREQFERNFRERGEVGASVCVTYRGETVVDLWGGTADPATGRPWEEDTVCVVWSSTKGATALCAHMLAARGELDLEAPVCEYWPEFAQNGKSGVTVAMLLAHQAGLAALSKAPKADAFCNWQEMTELLAAQAPLWEPGSRHGYHALTFGHLIGEVVRRITGRSLGRFFQEEVAGPLGLDFWIGLPEHLEGRVAPMIPPSAAERAQVSSQFFRLALESPGSIPNLFFVHSGDLMQPGAINQPAYHAAEIPAANGITHARGLAGMYRPLSLDGSFEGKRLVPEDALPRMGAVHSAAVDLMLQVPTRFTLGFLKAGDNTRPGQARADSFLVSEEAFGHPGSGGSVGFADPRGGLSFGYAMNKQGTGLSLNERGQSLVDATYRSIGYRQSRLGGLWFAPQGGRA